MLTVCEKEVSNTQQGFDSTPTKPEEFPTEVSDKRTSEYDEWLSKGKQ